MTYLLATTASGVWEVESLDGEDFVAFENQTFLSHFPELKEWQERKSVV